MSSDVVIIGKANFLSAFRKSERYRAYSVGFVDGAGTGIQFAVAGVLIAERFGLGAAGFVFGVGGLARFFGPALFWWLDRKGGGSKLFHRIFFFLVAMMTATSLGVVSAAAWGPLWIIFIVGFLWAFFNSCSTIIASSAVPKALFGYGPMAMVGSALGALVGIFAITGRNTVLGILVVGAILALQMLEPWLLSSVRFSQVAPATIFETIRHAGKGFILAGLTYGPLIIYQALTIKVASESWVGWSMVVYAAGALCAIPLSKRMRRIDSFPEILFLGAVGVGVWGFAVGGPLLLVGRFLSGLFLFLAQGRLLQLSYHTEDGNASTLRLAGMNTGLGLGASFGTIFASQVAELTSVTRMGLVLGVSTLSAAGFFFFVGKLRAIKS